MNNALVPVKTDDQDDETDNLELNGNAKDTYGVML